MKGFLLLLVVVCSVPSFAQNQTSGKSQTSGPCSPAVSGHHNNFVIKCKVDSEQGQKMIDILNTILENQLDPKAVMGKLDEILHAVNPNLDQTFYNCNGTWRTTGPSASGSFSVVGGGDENIPITQRMIDLANSHQYPELLTVCSDQMKAAPAWLTPDLFCSLADLNLGNRDEAARLLKEFDSKSGPAYQVGVCKQVSDVLHQSIPIQ